MRICFITERFYPYYGGAETRYYKIAQSLVTMGHEVLILTGNGDITGNHDKSLKLETNETINGIFVFRFVNYQRSFPRIFQRSPIDLIKFGIKLNQILSQIIDDWDIIELNTMPYLHSLVLPSSKLNKIVLTWHEIWGNYWKKHRFVGKLGQRVESRLLSKGRGHVYVSNFTKKRVSFYQPELVNPGIVIPNGVDNIISYEDKKSQDRPILLFVGRLVPDKNIHPLLTSSFSQFLKIYPSAELHIVGHGPDYKKIKQLSTITPNLYVHGILSEKGLENLYLNSNLFLLPSIREGSGIAAIEAMARGNLVITLDSDYNATGHEIVVHDYNGYVCRKEDFVNFMVKGFQERNRLGPNAIKTSSEYLWSTIASNLVNFYQTL